MLMRMPPKEFLDTLREALGPIDQWLASGGLRISERPMHAALEFISRCVLEISTDGGNTSRPPGDTSGILMSDWFRGLHKHVMAWYRERYGAQMDVGPKDTITGVVRIFGTPFTLKIPTTVHTPAELKTAWVQFPDQVLKEENCLSWVENGPNLANEPRSVVLKAKRLSNEIAGGLRFIRVNIMGVKAVEKLDELVGGILPQLERAAEQIVHAKPDALKRAYWDMQMACEHALKALSQQRAATFKETHDLFYLYDRMQDGPPDFTRNQLSKLPNWERVAELRYGGGDNVTLEKTFNAYRATLKIVSGTVDGLRRMKFGKARFKVQRPPWLSDE